MVTSLESLAPSPLQSLECRCVSHRHSSKTPSGRCSFTLTKVAVGHIRHAVTDYLGVMLTTATTNRSSDRKLHKFLTQNGETSYYYTIMLF